MQVLGTELRNKLERTIVQARDVAEAGAKAALEALAVHHHEPYGHMSPEQRKLRNHLRARARQLGDKQNRKGELEITHLVWECAYEHWHRMLFARFLAENALLIEPEMGVAISLEECEELAKEEGKDLWTLASEFAQRMLPQIFRPDDPLLKVTFAREHRLKLEQLLDGLEPSVFTASDSLGWVYQFWQTKRKKEVNEAGNKIGADELPAVTQLFTEPYMVNFLIHNTVGAWWAGKVLAEKPDLAQHAKTEEELRRAVALPGVTWDYLRFIRKDDGKGPWRPASGTFEGWAKSGADLKILDPSCGSGHFLVALLTHLVPIRMAEEGLNQQLAVESVLKENLYGLEIDERCTQISAFALALAALNYPSAGGYRNLPDMHIACSGKAPNTKKADWLSVASNDSKVQNAMERLYELFQQAPTIGSLIHLESALDEPLFQAGVNEITLSIEQAISVESNDHFKSEMNVTAKGIADAAKVLMEKYDLVITNVPYLGIRKQSKNLLKYLEKKHFDARHDLATAFKKRCILFCKQNGTVAAVLPQNWLFINSYESLRRNSLKKQKWNLLASLGKRAFETISGEVVNVVLLIITNSDPVSNHSFFGVDANDVDSPAEKASLIKNEALIKTIQSEHFNNPDSRIVLGGLSESYLLEKYAFCLAGIQNGDSPKFLRFFWEVPHKNQRWAFLQTAGSKTDLCGGLETIIDYDQKRGHLRAPKEWRRQSLHDSDQRGKPVWGKKGVLVGRMTHLPCTIYMGYPYDQSAAAIVPYDEELLPSVWCFCSSNRFHDSVRKIDKKVNVTSATLARVPFDLEYWQEVAKTELPNGLPLPHSDNPTQWIFKGAVAGSSSALHVSVARLLGYEWPQQEKDRLEEIIDVDGIVCIPSIRGEDPASERLRAILATAYDNEWTTSREMELLAATGSKAKNLGEWLQDDFFEQHSKVFLHRPFIWHIWDGRRRDGFHALVNYHKLAEGNGKGRQLLESLTYSYLGDWITRQKEGVKRGEGGAEDRLAAALELQKKLIAIIEGEPPFDIFVRWKPIEGQPIGWEPDINDGVRLNIRPFMAQDIPGGRKGAGVLRWKPNIKWNKDRGKEPYRPQEQYPWFWKDGEFIGDRVNDIHLSNEEKRQAREKAKKNK